MPANPGIGGGSAVPLTRPNNRNRYEFIMMFVWREPLGVDSTSQ
jgi:hypothetical protein